MNKEEALKIVDDNANSCNNSYLDYIHERSRFNEQSFWKFYNAIRLLGYTLRNENFLPRDLTSKILKSYEWHLLLIGFHFDPKDGFRLADLPENFSQYSLRLRHAVTAYLQAKPISDELEGFLNEDLENKLINECPNIP